MKAFDESRPKTSTGRPHPSLCGEVLRTLGADERSQTDILTWLQSSLPPSRPALEQWLWEFVAVTVAQPSRNLTGFPDI